MNQGQFNELMVMLEDINDKLDKLVQKDVGAAADKSSIDREKAKKALMSIKGVGPSKAEEILRAFGG